MQVLGFEAASMAWGVGSLPISNFYTAQNLSIRLPAVKNVNKVISTSCITKHMSSYSTYNEDRILEIYRLKLLHSEPRNRKKYEKSGYSAGFRICNPKIHAYFSITNQVLSDYPPKKKTPSLL
jgi:hypothetical protein